MPAALLTETEQKQLDKLLAKANAANVHSPALRVGEEYIALVNLSLPRRDNKPAEKDYVPQCDLVLAGNPVWLTEAEAATFNRHNPQLDGRRIPVVVKKSELGQWQRVHPSLLSGPVFRPPVPAQGSNIDPEIPRPDPAGASRIIESSPVPELNQPFLGSETHITAADATDITPGTGNMGADPRAVADMDVVNAAKAAMSRQKG